MTDTPWTPGPWAWVRKRSGFYHGLEGGDGSSVFCADEYAGSCWLELESEANARLIAAAPDMAETLIWLRENLRDATTSEIEHLIDQVIAKARSQA